MVKKPHVRNLFISALLLTLAAAARAEPQIRNLTAVANGSSVSVHFTLAGAFDDAEVVRGLQSGLPLRFGYIVEIYRDRPNWFDDGIGHTRIEVTASFNSITREYALEVRRDRKLDRSETFTDLDSLERRMTTIDEPALFDIGRRRPYKLRVRAKADFGRTFLFYIVPSSNSTRWRNVRVAAVAEPAP